MVYKDYYKLLELETSRVSFDEIKTAYRTVAKKYHPDVNIGNKLAEERIKDINEAYRVLSNPSSKRKFDRIWNAKNINKNYRKIDKKNIISMFFGDVEPKLESKTEKIKKDGEDIETEIDTSIKEAYFGLGKRITLRDLNSKDKVIDIKIPEAIKDGEKIRLIGQGKPGKNGGKNGDLFIKINIKDDNKFKLLGCDLYTTIPITPWEAALGTKINFMTIDNEEITIFIPQGIQSGEKIIIPDKGYKDGNGGRGKLYAEVKILVPKELTSEEEKAFMKLAKISKFNPREK